MPTNRHRRFQSSLLSLILFHFTVCAPAKDVTVPPELAPVRAYIEQSLSSNRMPSLAVAVVRDDRVIWAEGFGYADLATRRKANSDSIYLLASVSKPITATGLMLLVQRGLVNLDRPANDYLPGPKLYTRLGSADAMTVRRLANHTSGLPTHYNFFFDDVRPPTRDETIRRYGFASKPPGSTYEYSNLGFGVLDYITSVVSHQPWQRFMEKEVFDPIGMKHSSPRVRPGLEKEATVQYVADTAGRFVPVGSYRFDHDGASTIWSSANDLARFLRLHLNGGVVDGKRLLREETAREMLRATAKVSPDRPELGVGIAWNLESYLGMRAFGHSGGMPGVATQIRAFPTERVAYAVLVNVSDGTIPVEVSRRITRALFPNATERSRNQTRAENGSPAAFAGEWHGTLGHFSGDIPLLVSVTPDGAAKAGFGGRPTMDLDQVVFRSGRFGGHTRVILETQPSYHGPVDLDLVLTPVEDGRLCGVAYARAAGYFMLPHWVELTR